MSTYASTSDPQDDYFGSGIAGAVILHLAIVGIIIAAALFAGLHRDRFGESTAAVGAIQASMVPAIPLPNRGAPIDKSVLAPEDISKVAAPPPKEATQPPPKPTDIEVKSRTTPTKVAPVTAPTPPKHPQPTPDTPKASTGQQATQLPQSVLQTTDGTATITVQNRAMGERYAYYIRLVGAKVQQTYSQQYKDPRTSNGKSVTILFMIDNTGAPTNIQIQTPSGSTSLDNAGKRALQEIDTFGPNPANQPIPIALQFVYQHQ